MKASIDLLTGLMVESCSTSTNETLLDNAEAQGYKRENIQIKSVNYTELDDLIAARDLGQKTPTEIKLHSYEHIKAERDRRTDSGGYSVEGKWFHSHLRARCQQIGLFLLGDLIPNGVQWKTMDGSFVPMTRELAAKIFAAAVASDIAIFAAAEDHIAAMQISANPNDYDFSKSWPKIYGE